MANRVSVVYTFLRHYRRPLVLLSGYYFVGTLVSIQREILRSLAAWAGCVLYTPVNHVHPDIPVSAHGFQPFSIHACKLVLGLSLN